MGFRFQKRIPLISRLVWLNASTKGFSISIGVRGFVSLNFSKRGVMGSINIPVSGASYRKQFISFKSNKLKEESTNEPVSTDTKAR
jgi:hypothetical protein